jgi:hypothetical protein
VGKLLDLIRGERHRRTGSSDGEFMVIFVNNFSGDIVPYARLVGGGALIEMAADEPFEVFKERAVAAAKAQGANFVAINVPAPLTIEGGARSNSVWGGTAGNIGG